MGGLSAAILWILLLATVSGLSLLLWTRWGEYRPLAKSFLLSLLLHACILLFASTLDLAERIRPAEEPEETVWLESIETEAEGEAEGAGGLAALNQPWDRFSPGRELGAPELDDPVQDLPSPGPMPAALERGQRELAPDAPLPTVPGPEAPQPQPATARRDVEPALQRASESELSPQEPVLEPERVVPRSMEFSGELVAPTLEDPTPRRRLTRDSAALFDEGVGEPLPEAELRVVPHEESEALVRRDATQDAGGPAASETPLQPELPRVSESAPPASQLDRGLVRARLPERPATIEREPTRQTRRPGIAQQTMASAATSLAPAPLPRLQGNSDVAETARGAIRRIPPPAAEADTPTEAGVQPRQPAEQPPHRVADRRRLPLPSGLAAPKTAFSDALPRVHHGRATASTSGLAVPDRALIGAQPHIGTTTGADTGTLPVRNRAELAAVPTELRLRVSPERSEILLRRGGSEKTERAVDAALAWLAAHQSPDGRWDADGFGRLCPEVAPCGGEGTLRNEDTAITGLALLAFLGAGHTHLSGPYATNIRKGLGWLLQQQRPDGDLRGTGRMYAHAIATLALCEAYALTRDKALWGPAYRAAMFIVYAQNPQTGGWRYQPRAVICDTSVFGWQLLALRGARIAGIQVPDTTWERAQNWLRLASWGKAGGLASYLQRSMDRHGPTPPMTAEALACRLFLGVPVRDPAVQEAVQYLLENLPDYRVRNVYYWYYASLSLSQVGGEVWARWNERMQDILLRTQRRSGHAVGSWDPAYNVAWDTVGGRIYTTALSTLCLEVYYRYAPEARR